MPYKLPRRAWDFPPTFRARRGVSLLSRWAAVSMAPVWLPLAAPMAIFGIDWVLSRSPAPTILQTAAMDEPGHLLTAAIILAALPGLSVATRLTALVGSVVIDLDHLPLYLFGSAFAVDGGRPQSHSLAAILVLWSAAGLVKGAARTYLVGAGLGVVLHLVRDAGTGPGVPLLWPVWPHAVRMPYGIYLVALGVAAIVAAVLAWSRWTGMEGVAGGCRPGPRGSYDIGFQAALGAGRKDYCATGLDEAKPAQPRSPRLPKRGGP